MVMSLWEQVVGPLIAKKSWPEQVSDGVLAIGVTSHAWSAELQLLKPQILTRYRQLLGRSILKDVSFRVGRRKVSASANTASDIVPLHPRAGETLASAPLPPTILSGVSNPEVRELLAPVFARLCAQRVWKREHGWAHCHVCDRIYHGLRCPNCAQKGLG
jgi:predicted nucleic acid-binding Zn ribbon protein